MTQLRKTYIDTLLAAYDRQEAAGFYEEKFDLKEERTLCNQRHRMQKKRIATSKRGIKAAGLGTHESYLVYAYYATYLVYNAAQGDEKAALKKRMIEDYFKFSEMVSKAGMTPQTQETLTTYLDYVVESCDALLPEIPGYITNLPEDNAAAIEAIQANDYITRR